MLTRVILELKDKINKSLYLRVEVFSTAVLIVPVGYLQSVAEFDLGPPNTNPSSDTEKKVHQLLVWSQNFKAPQLQFVRSITQAIKDHCRSDTMKTFSVLSNGLNLAPGAILPLGNLISKLLIHIQCKCN